jgi:hypothetical protein
VGQTLYDVGGSIGYTLTGDEQYYGASADRLYGVTSALTGGEDNSTAYRVGYTGTQIAALVYGGQALNAGRAGEAGVLAERAAAAGEAIQGTRALRLPATADLVSQYGPGVRGVTLPNGQVILQQGLSRAEQATTLAHESVHSFLTPRSGPFVGFRQQLGQFAYDNSQLVRFSEEVAAQTYATGSLRLGIQHGFNPYYQISIGGLATEGAVYGGAVGGGFYLGTKLGGSR